MTRLSPMRCSRNVINQSRGIVSKYARRSASTIQLTLRRSIPKARASSASCAPRPRSEPVAEAKKLHLVNRCQDHIHNRLLDDLVLQRRDPERSCSAVRLRYLYPPNRRRPVRSPSAQAPVQVEQALFQTLAVHVPRNAVNARRSVPPQGMERPVQRVRRDVVEERSETFLRVSLCSFPYPGRRLWHACPTLGSARALAIRIPLGLRPFPPATPHKLALPCSPPSQVVRPHPTSSNRSSQTSVFSIPYAAPLRHPGQFEDLPGSRQKACERAWVL